MPRTLRILSGGAANGLVSRLQAEFEKKNDCKLEGWGKDNDRKLEGWGKDNDRKLEGWGKDNDRKLAEMERKIDARFDSQGRWFRWIAGLLVSILLAVIFT